MNYCTLKQGCETSFSPWAEFNFTEGLGGHLPLVGGGRSSWQAQDIVLPEAKEKVAPSPILCTEPNWNVSSILAMKKHPPLDPKRATWHTALCGLPPPEATALLWALLDIRVIPGK